MSTTEPGQDDYTVVNLRPGRYALVCAIPVGEQGPPHFTEGMRSLIKVS